MHDGKSFIVKFLGLPLLVALMLSFVFLFIELEPDPNGIKWFENSTIFLLFFLVFYFIILVFIAPIEHYMARRLPKM